MTMLETSPGIDAEIVFSALPSKEAKQAELSFAEAGHQVFSNASAHRMGIDVPLIIPEVNAEHAELVKYQRQKRKWSGCLVTSSNCTSTGLTISLKPLLDAFGIQRVFAVSLQALSGAGYPGVPSIDLIDNIVPYIGGEEEKIEIEPRKMLGSLSNSYIEYADFTVSAHANRVPVVDGHTVCVSISLEEPASPEQAVAAFETFQLSKLVQALPSSPSEPIVVRREPDRPQPRRDRLAGDGMTTTIGRVRPDPNFHLRYVVLSHNTVKGAAGGSLQNAELLLEMGII
jgi:aspartate-semialdehyde dehydrogenase